MRIQIIIIIIYDPHIRLLSSESCSLASNLSDLSVTEIRYAASFFDLDEDGVEDIFVLAQQPLRIIGLFNNIQNDAFFLKAVGMYYVFS